MDNKKVDCTYLLEEASKKAVKQGLSNRVWPVYRHYEIAEEGGEPFVIAQRPAGSLMEWTERGDGVLVGRFHSHYCFEDVMTHYAPLWTPELVVELADMADREVTPHAVLEWAQIYGILGLPEEDVLEVQDGPMTGRVVGEGRRENVARFAEAAGEIGACLRMYEAATADEDPDLEKLSPAVDALSEAVVRPRPGRAGEERTWLLSIVADVVQMRLEEHCFLQLTNGAVSGIPLGRFSFGPAFKNLFGAARIQMAWLLSSDDVKRCKLPDCARVIWVEPGEPAYGIERNRRGTYKTRSDKRYCSVNCRVKYNQRKKAGRLGYV